MQISTDTYNLSPFSADTVLSGISIDYRKTKELLTTKEKVRFHYEFWSKDKSLYASIHCDHANPNSGFIKYLKDTYNLLFKKALAKKGFTDIDNITLTGLSDKGNSGTNTHSVNIKCKRGLPEQNALLLKNLIEVSLKILSAY